MLKNKDPGAIIEELDKLDEMEYNVNEPPQLAEKVLKDKRRKLKETLDRVMKLYVSWLIRICQSKYFFSFPCNLKFFILMYSKKMNQLIGTN